MRSDLVQRRRGVRAAGYLLFEVILAVTVFSVAFVGLVKVVNQTSLTANGFSFDRLVDDGLAAILAEAKQREVSQMAMQTRDELTGVSYHTEVEPLSLATGNGKNLKDIYQLRATAVFNVSGTEESRQADVWIYRPKSDEKGTR